MLVVVSGKVGAWLVGGGGTTLVVLLLVAVVVSPGGVVGVFPAAGLDISVSEYSCLCCRGPNSQQGKTRCPDGASSPW